MAQTLAQIENSPVEALSGRWMVRIFNNDHTPVLAVIHILMVATGCSREEAEIETWEAEHYGQASVHFDGEIECRRVAGVIDKIGVQTAVCPEWEN
jgi:hypothetical protein